MRFPMQIRIQECQIIAEICGSGTLFFYKSLVIETRAASCLQFRSELRKDPAARCFLQGSQRPRTNSYSVSPQLPTLNHSPSPQLLTTDSNTHIPHHPAVNTFSISPHYPAVNIYSSSPQLPSYALSPQLTKVYLAICLYLTHICTYIKISISVTFAD
jgi:hypothetical protein